MSLEYKQGCPLVKKLVGKLDVIVGNYSKSNRQEIKELSEKIVYFRNTFSSTFDLYDIRMACDNILFGLLKDEIEELDKIILHYKKIKMMVELREEGGTVFVMTEDDYNRNRNGIAPCDISPCEEDNKSITVGDIKKMLEDYPDDMIAFGQSEGGLFPIDKNHNFKSALEDETLEDERLYVPSEYKHVDKHGDKEFLIL